MSNLETRVARLEKAAPAGGPPLWGVALDVPGGRPDQALYGDGRGWREVPDGTVLLAAGRRVNVYFGLDLINDL